MSEKWLCLGCHFLLGWVENGNMLRIKRKDLYVEILDAKKVIVNCCRCGKPNELTQKPDAVIPLSETR